MEQAHNKKNYIRTHRERHKSKTEETYKKVEETRNKHKKAEGRRSNH